MAGGAINELRGTKRGDEVDTAVRPQPLFTEPRHVVNEFAVGEDEDITKKTMASVNWVVSEEPPSFAEFSFFLLKI